MLVVDPQQEENTYSREDPLLFGGVAAEEGYTPGKSSGASLLASTPLPAPPKTLLPSLASMPLRPSEASCSLSYSALTRPGMLVSSSVTSRIQSLLPVETMICLSLRRHHKGAASVTAAQIASRGTEWWAYRP